MAIAFKIWLSIIELLIFTLSGVFIVVYGIVALCMPDTKSAGILTLIVDIFLPLPPYWLLLINPSLTSQVFLREPSFHPD
jgi:hypothetical protein